MKEFTYTTKGTCSRFIDFDLSTWDTGTLSVYEEPVTDVTSHNLLTSMKRKEIIDTDSMNQQKSNWILKK